MCEITNKNFKENLPQIREILGKSKFISIDLEFSALHPIRNQNPSLFDTSEQRYEKLKRNLEHVIPLQVGLTAFLSDPDKNRYDGRVFTFYVTPVSFGAIDKTYFFQASSVKFLCLHKFDFNKFAYSGIPYLNVSEEQELRSKFNDLVGDNCSLRWEYDSSTNHFTPAVEKWYKNAKIGDILEIPEIHQRYGEFYEILYFLHKYFRERFKNVWTSIENNCFFIKKITNDEFVELSRKDDIKNELIENSIGFRDVYDLLKTLKKPLIGHNLFQDLMIMFNCFEQSLPRNYRTFKTTINGLFPIIFDTKTLFYELRSKIPKNKLPTDTSLSILFDYFKNGAGSRLIRNTPEITGNLSSADYNNYHHAGFDSYCTGFIFLHMAYINIAPKYPETKIFVSSEIIASLNQYKNRLNIIRGSINHIKLDGEDPNSTRPPWLVIRSINKKPLNLKQLSLLLGTYGSVDIKMLSLSSNRRALIAVDTSRTAEDILKHFKNNPEFRITQYNIFKHSTFIQSCLLGGLTISGFLLIVYSYKS